MHKSRSTNHCANRSMKAIDFKYAGSVTPKATTFLTSPAIDMSFTSTYDVQDSDAANAATLQKEFKSAMDTAIKTQLSHLNKWLTEKDALIAGMMEKHKTMKAGFPGNAAQAADYKKKVDEMAIVAKQMSEFPKDYAAIVTGWAKNCEQQQGLIAMQTAVKAARIKTFEAKNFRVKLGIAIKITLAVATTALAIAAIVLTAGATAPLFVGLAAAGIALSGIGSIGGIAKVIVDSGNTEKKILASATKDVEAIQQAFGGVKDKSSSLKKHVTELSNLILMREGKLTELDNDVKKYTAQAAGYDKIVVALDAELKKGALVDAGKIAAKKKASTDVTAKLKDSQAKITAIKADNQKARDLLKELSSLGVELDKVSGQGASTLLGNIKARFSGVDGWLDLSNTVGGLAGSAAGAHA